MPPIVAKRRHSASKVSTKTVPGPSTVCDFRNTLAGDVNSSKNGWAGSSDDSRREFFQDDLTGPEAEEILLDRGDFQIRVANSCGMNQSEVLVERMYSSRGYRRSTQDFADREANEITLQACHDGTVFGTLTIRFDSERGLAADMLYREEIDAYRNAGARIAELTRLAVDPKLGSKEVLGALFHLAYVCTGPLRAIGDVFIEVHPRHVPFYQRMLNFRQVGECRTCPRVDAPAVLLHVEVAYVAEQIALYGGHQERRTRSLYPYFFSMEEEQGLSRRLLGIGREHDTSVARLPRLEPLARGQSERSPALASPAV